MQKLALKLEELRVESCETGSADERGTVIAHAATLIIQPCTTKFQTCPAVDDAAPTLP